MNVLGHSGQSYDAWFTDYPSTHKCAGQAVEVVTRAAYDRLAATTPGAVSALEEIASYHEHGRHSAITPATLAAVAQKALDRLRGQ